MEGTMRICLDGSTGSVSNGDGDDGGVGGEREGEAAPTTRIAGGAKGAAGFVMALDEQWRGTSAAPSMKMT